MASLLDSPAQIDPNALAAVAPDPTLPSAPSLLQRLKSGFDTFQNGYDKFNQGLAAGMQSPLFTLGMGLIEGAQPFQNAGSGIMNAMQWQQQMREQRQKQALNALNVATMVPWLQRTGQMTPQMQGLLGQIIGPQPGLLPNMAATSASPSQPASPLFAPAAQGTPGVTSTYTPPRAQGASQSQQAPQQPQQPQDGWAALGDPRQMLATGAQYAGSPVPFIAAQGKAMVQEAQAILQNNPQYVTARAAAANPLAQDQYGIQQAQASGNPLALQAARMKYLTDSKLVNPAAYNGNVTTFGGLTPQQLGMSTFSPSTGIQTQNGQAALMPGYAAAEQQRAGAQAQGEAQGKTINLVNPSNGASTPVPLDKYLSFMQQFTPAQAAAGQTPISALGPGQEHQLATTGEESGRYISDLQTQADNARQANYTLDQMSTAAKGVVLGPAAPAKAWMQNATTAMAQMFGVTPPAKALGSYQELTKYANQVAFAATRQMGSREAAQIVHLQMESNPNPRLMPQAFSDLVGSMQALNSYVIDKNNAIQAVATDKASALRAASTWTSQVDPRVWDLGLSPAMASKFAPQIGSSKIATALPFMQNDEAIAVMRNLPTAMRAQVLRGLPDNVAQQLLTGLQQSSGATGTY